MHFSAFAKSAAVSLLLIVGFALPTHAQNNKPIRSGDWYEDRAGASITDSLLVLTFAQSPTDKFLNVTNVACTVAVATSQSVATIQLVVGTASGQNDLNRPYQIKGNTTPETVGASKYYSVVTNQVFYKIGPGRFPSIAILTGAVGSMGAQCVIVGNLTDN